MNYLESKSENASAARIEALGVKELSCSEGGSGLTQSNDSLFGLQSSPADLVSNLSQSSCDCGYGCYVDFPLLSY